MLSLNGYANRLCDGLTRREILKVGALGMGGLSLPNLLRAEQARGILKSQRP